MAVVSMLCMQFCTFNQYNSVHMRMQQSPQMTRVPDTSEGFCSHCKCMQAFFFFLSNPSSLSNIGKFDGNFGHISDLKNPPKNKD